MPPSAFTPTALPRASRPTPPTPQSRTPHMRTPPPRRLLLAGALAAGGYLLLRRQPPVHADPGDKIVKTDEQWRSQLTPAQYRVLRQNGTEWAFTSPLNSEYRKGLFRCAGCTTPLFTSDTKFDSGTGWPSFSRPLPGAVRYVQTARDRLLLQREVRCATCDGHLGHVFADGPKPTGMRYCMNGVALTFESQ